MYVSKVYIKRQHDQQNKIVDFGLKLEETKLATRTLKHFGNPLEQDMVQ